MEYKIDYNGNKRADLLDIAESYEVFYLKGIEYIHIADAETEKEAEQIKAKSQYPNEYICIWDNRINN